MGRAKRGGDGEAVLLRTMSRQERDVRGRWCEASMRVV